jgi:flagellar hook-associated protein 2
VSDVIADTTLTLTAADPTVTANVTVDRDQKSAQSAVQSYVDAYNAVVDFIQKQQTPGSDPTKNPTLYNDSILRSARSALAQSTLATVTGAAPDLSTVGMAGVSLTKDGHLTLDSSKFQTAFTTRFDDVQTLFMERGSSTNPQAFYTSSTAATQSGTYALNITQAATQATLLGAGFSGTYADDATPDVMTVTDVQHNTSVQVQLTNGMTTQQIADALNTAFATPQQRVVQTSNVMLDATGSTPATASTLITDLHQPGGGGGGAVAGDSLTWTGVRPDGTPYSGSFAVGPAATVADVVNAVQASLGTSATVSFANGQFTATSNSAGNSQLTFSIASDNKGGGQLNFGTQTIVAAGHGVAGITASVVNNQLQLSSAGYGSAASIRVAFQGGGTDSTAQLGLSTTPATGTDVQGTIGGFAATGSGQSLLGATGTAVDGLSVLYTGTATGAAGTVSLTQGLGATVDRLLTGWTQLGGTVDMKEQQLNDKVTTQQSRLDAFNARMDVRRQALLKEYLAMDTAVQKLNAQGSAFLSALGSGSSSTSGSSVFG